MDPGPGSWRRARRSSRWRPALRHVGRSDGGEQAPCKPGQRQHHARHPARLDRARQAIRATTCWYPLAALARCMRRRSPRISARNTIRRAAQSRRDLGLRPAGVGLHQVRQHHAARCGWTMPRANRRPRRASAEMQRASCPAQFDVRWALKGALMFTFTRWKCASSARPSRCSVEVARRSPSPR